MGKGSCLLRASFVSWGVSCPRRQSHLVAELAAALGRLWLSAWTGHSPHFPKLGSVFVQLWKCGCKGAEGSREALQDSGQFPSPRINGAQTFTWQCAEKQIKTAKLSSPFLHPPISDRFILESDRRLMESLNFLDNKLPPSALIECFTTNIFLLHRLLLGFSCSKSPPPPFPLPPRPCCALVGLASLGCRMLLVSARSLAGRSYGIVGQERKCEERINGTRV